MKQDTGASQGGEEQSTTIQRLREEIRGVIEREYALLGNYREFADSFEAVIPDENLRHEAVLQALSTTFKLGRQEIVEALDRQHEELALLEKAVSKLFADIGAKTAAGRQGMEGPRAGSVAPAKSAIASPQATANKDCPMCGERIAFDRNGIRWTCHSCSYEEALARTAGAEQKQENPGTPPSPTNIALQRTCPMCGGQMHFHAHERRWLCYTCAHEEAPADDVQGAGQGTREQTGVTGPAPAPSFAVSLADMVADESGKLNKGARVSPGQLTGKPKICSLCRKKMNWHEQEKQWRCIYCGHKTR